jgi:hypothetical protein
MRILGAACHSDYLGVAAETVTYLMGIIARPEKYLLAVRGNLI